MAQTSAAEPAPVPDGAGEGEAANIRTVFIGLVLGMFLGAVNMTIVAPAMPRIVAQLGGMEHYSWIAVSSLLASTVIVPVVGKLLAAGCFLLTTMGRDTSHGAVVRNMVLIGLGLGAAMQTFVLVVQNAVSREDLGVATATTQLSRSIGSTLGTAILGTMLAQGMAREMAGVGGIAAGGGGGEMGAGSLLDPEAMARLTPAALEGVRAALAAALHPVFLATLPPVILAIGAALVMREVPLRRGRPAEEATEAGREILAEMVHAGADDAEPVLGRPTPEYRERTAFLGLAYALLAARARQDGTSHLDGLVGRLGAGDVEAGTARLEAVARALLRECDEGPGDCGDELLATLGGRDGRFPPGLDPATALERATAQRPAELRARLNALVSDRSTAPSAVLTPADLGALERIGRS